MEKIYALPLIEVNLIMCAGIVLWTLLFWLVGRHYYRHFRIVNLVMAVIAIIAIIYITIMSRNPNTQNVEVNLIPFYSFCKVQHQPEVYRSMVMNVFLFFPLGLFLPFAISGTKNGAVIKMLTFAVLISALIELFQFKFRLGSCETDDVIMNTLGAAVGSLGFVISRLLCNIDEERNK